MFLKFYAILLFCIHLKGKRSKDFKSHKREMVRKINKKGSRRIENKKTLHEKNSEDLILNHGGSSI